MPSYENVDLVIESTLLLYLDSAVQEGIPKIFEALEENGRVIVTDCLGAKEQIREVILRFEVQSPT